MPSSATTIRGARRACSFTLKLQNLCFRRDKAGLSKFLPVDGAFYLYADISEFSDDSFDFAKRLLEEAHVAATPGVDFDPIDGRHFLRFSYAGSAADMKEAVERIGGWLRKSSQHMR